MRASPRSPTRSTTRSEVGFWRRVPAGAASIGRVSDESAENPAEVRGAHDAETIFPAERVKAFADAVVAIAMTLLILPLMESVSDIASGDAGAESSVVAWFGAHGQQLMSFVVSFLIIAMFWISHHRQFVRVTRASAGLLWLLMAWLLTIVWLPVATAMSGQFGDEEPAVKIVYIGSMILVALASLGIRLYLRVHPALHDLSDTALRRGASVDIALAVLFALALGLSLAFPALGYYPMFLMFLSGIVQSLIARAMGVPRG